MSDDDTAVVLIPLSVELVERIRQLANRERLTLTQWCALAIGSAAMLERGVGE